MSLATMPADKSLYEPQEVLRGYLTMCQRVYGQQPRVRSLGNGWFQVSGELVHYLTLVGEVERLQAQLRAQQVRATDKGMIRRLIDRLRGI